MAWAVVNGEVNRVFFDGKGISIKETFEKQDGTEGAAYYTAFFNEDPGLGEGTRGKFSGFLSVKSREFEKDGVTKHSADAVLNSARFEAEEASADTPF